MKKQNGFANIALVVVIVIIVGAVGYFALRKTEPIVYQTPTPTPTQTKTPTSTPTGETANWKTYTNTQYGFEFKYPGDWELTSNAILSGSPDDEEFYINKPNSKERVRIAVTSNRPSLLLSPDGPVNGILIAGIPSHEQSSEGYSDAGKSSGPFVELWIKKNELYYSFILYNTREIFVEGDYNEILSTFKFIK